MKSLALAVAGLLLLGNAAGAAPGDAVYTQPGTLVPSGAGRLNFYCMGNGSPAVVFEAGHTGWSPVWAVVQPRIAAWTQACSYDRAGLGFSDPGPKPRTSARIAAELYRALHEAGVPGPYILVGRAFGGTIVRNFADDYLPEVAGLVLIDTDARDVEPAALDKRWPDFFARQHKRLQACRDAVAEHKPWPSLPGRLGGPPRTCDDEFLTGDPAFSPELNAKLQELAHTRVDSYDEVISELDELLWDDRYLRSHRKSLGARPLRLLTPLR